MSGDVMVCVFCCGTVRGDEVCATCVTNGIMRSDKSLTQRGCEIVARGFGMTVEGARAHGMLKPTDGASVEKPMANACSPLAGTAFCVAGSDDDDGGASCRGEEVTS